MVEGRYQEKLAKSFWIERINTKFVKNIHVSELQNAAVLGRPKSVFLLQTRLLQRCIFIQT